MNSIIDLSKTVSQPEQIVGSQAFSLINTTSKDAMNAANDPSYIPFCVDPLQFITSANKVEINSTLQQLSATSTKGYIKSFMSCIASMEYLVDSESKVGELFMNNASKKQQLIMSLIYLVNFPKIDTVLYTKLLYIIETCTVHETLSARNTMTRMGIVWTEETLDDPILAQFLTKAAYAEYGLQKVA